MTVVPRATIAQAPLFSDAELDQMLAPIALYPDVLLTQTLIASTYPSEAIEAGNWLKANPDLRGKEAVEAASQTSWDDSIKSLAAFPEIMVPMAEYPDWTTGLGNAFLSQQQQLMNRVQYLRQKAKEQGNLQTNEQVRVQTTEQKTIVIEPATTQIVYVPYYNPTVVYGSWWWPAYSPVYWNPYPYAGYVTGYSSGFMWSGAGLWFSYTSYRPVYDWHYRRVYIVDRHYRRPGPHRKPMPRREWSHKPEHRHDVSYRDKTYKPGPNTPGSGQHGKPAQRPNGTPGGNSVPGKNDRPSADKNGRPGSPQIGLTDRNQNGSRPGSSKGKPFDIPRKNNNLTHNQRPENGQGNPAGPGMSGTRPVISQSGQGSSAYKPAGNRPEMNGPANRPQINRPGSRPEANNPSNRQPGQSQSLNRPGSNRPMMIPSVNQPTDNRPVQGPSGNRPTDSRPAPNPAINQSANNPSRPGPSANRPTINRPIPTPAVNRPRGNQPTAGSTNGRPMPERPAMSSSASRPVTSPPAAGQPVSRPTASRPAPPVSRPATTSRPVSSASRQPSPGSSASVPSNSRPAAIRPSGAVSNRAASAPSRPAPGHQGKPSASDRKDDRGHGR